MDSFNFLRDGLPISIPSIAVFNAAESFVPTHRSPNPVQPEVRIVCVTDTFIECVGDVGVTDRNIDACKFHMSIVRKTIPPDTCIKMVGLIDKPFRLAHIFWAMKAQVDGGKGPLLVNRWNNSFVVSRRWVVLLRYYSRALAIEEMKKNERVDMWYPADGWVVDAAEKDSEDWSKWSRQGNRLGRYR